MSHIFSVYSKAHYVKIPIPNKYFEQVSKLKKNYQQNYYLAFLCFRKYFLGKATLLQNNLIKVIFPSVSTEKLSNVYLIVNKRNRILNPNYNLNIGTKQYINPKTIYVFGSIVENEMVFYGWLTGKEILELRRYHPKGEKKVYWVGNEEKVYVNKWEHYSVKIEDLHRMPEIKPQQEITRFFN